MFLYRMFSYDQVANQRNAISALQLEGCCKPVPAREGEKSTEPATLMKWYRLDDGVMGGKSESEHVPLEDGAVLHFKGTINTNGGGFCSIRSKFTDRFMDSTAKAIKIVFRGDGKTYKLLVSDGNPSMGPFAKSPSWQADLVTKRLENDDEWEEITVPFSSFLPNFGGPSAKPEEDKAKYTFKAEDMRELGLMLSMKLSNASPNPTETFGRGIFTFSLAIKSMEIMKSD